MIRKKGIEEWQTKSTGITNVRLNLAKKHTGFLISTNFVPLLLQSSEGSLTQHLKIKHPDYFAKIGLSQLSALKDFDEFKDLANEEKSESGSKQAEKPQENPLK